MEKKMQETKGALPKNSRANIEDVLSEYDYRLYVYKPSLDRPGYMDEIEFDLIYDHDKKVRIALQNVRVDDIQVHIDSFLKTNSVKYGNAVSKAG